MSENIKIEFRKNYRVELAKSLQGHYYSVTEIKANGKEKFIGYFVSVTTFLNSYPTSEHLVKWIAENGFHESRAMRDAAGRAGTKIHAAIENLLNGAELREPEYTTEEWVKLESFVNWHKVYKPKVLGLEVPIFSKKGRYAGRVDCVAVIAGQLIVADWKSSANIHKSFPLQFSAYGKALEENTTLKIDAVAALQLGAKNKDGYRWILYPDWKEKYYPVFESVQRTWLYDNYDSLKNPKDLPILHLPTTLKLSL